MILRLYRTKSLMYMGLVSSSNEKLKGKYRITRLSMSGLNQTYINKKYINPWLPEEEAIANIESIAQAEGWTEEEVSKWRVRPSKISMSYRTE